MSIEVELRRLIAGFGVTGATIRSGRARNELTLVRVLVAILAALVLDGLVEIGGFVTLTTHHFRVLPIQRKLSCVVMEG